MHEQRVIPYPGPREPAPQRVSQAWRWVAAGLAVAALLLAGLLVRATRPGPTHAAAIYSEWADLMYATLAPNAVGIWNGPTEIARGPYAYNQRAYGMLSGVNIAGDTNSRLQSMVSYLMTIDNQLDFMLTDTLAQPSGARQQADARYVRTVIRQNILAPLSGLRTSTGIEPPQPITSDDRALATTSQLCRIAATVELQARQRFVNGGVPAGVRHELFAACAQGRGLP